MAAVKACALLAGIKERTAEGAQHDSMTAVPACWTGTRSWFVDVRITGTTCDVISYCASRISLIERTMYLSPRRDRRVVEQPRIKRLPRCARASWVPTCCCTRRTAYDGQRS